MDERRAHVVVAFGSGGGGSAGVCVLDEIELKNILSIKSREVQAGLERMRLGNFLD
jgi:hypothetical protein